ncbi:MAG: substrate-binding domain-containing protein [Nitrospiraceae bacterium]|nr:substrate-binding domain-containing protein [Nitrospiraceae bacterium]
MDTIPAITGRPVVDGPKILDWPSERGGQEPSLGEPTANLVNDLHAGISQCDMVLSTSGNYHMALGELWDLYLKGFPADAPLRNWLYTTSPPIAKLQITNGLVRFGNFLASCRPQVAVGPEGLIDSLAAAGFTTGGVLRICRSRGNVILVGKGNPKGIFTPWDLGRRGVRLMTPNPATEAGSFRLYASSIYHIALCDKVSRPQGMTAKDLTAKSLFDAIFNGAGGGPRKWLCGRRIHHREIPWSIAYGKADAGVIFYHLARHAKAVFPDLFDVVPLGGTAEEPAPLPGNHSETLYAVRIKGDWSRRQRYATERLMELFRSRRLTSILKRHGLARFFAKTPFKNLP